MNDQVKKEAQEQAEAAYKFFLRFMKLFSYICVVGLLVVASCNFGVDGTGSKSDPALYEEYKERMLEMQEEIK